MEVPTQRPRSIQVYTAILSPSNPQKELKIRKKNFNFQSCSAPPPATTAATSAAAAAVQELTGRAAPSRGARVAAMARHEAAAGVVDFHLPDEILAVIPTDPYEQLDVARKITSMAIASRVSRLEADAARLRRDLADRHRAEADLRARLADSDARLLAALDENVSPWDLASLGCFRQQNWDAYSVWFVFDSWCAGEAGEGEGLARLHGQEDGEELGEGDSIIPILVRIL